MIGVLFWLAQILAGPIAPSSPPAYPELAPAVVLERYAAALEKARDPQVLTFDYTLEQTGPRTDTQTHRVFRSGSDERDETFTHDGKPIPKPIVRIFRGRRNRYTVGALAPRVADYIFDFAGVHKDARHLDYVFRLTPKSARQFAITEVTIDGVRFLPLSVAFETALNEGAGSITFGSNSRWWVPYVATAHAMIADDAATEKLTFYTYRFPSTLPPSTFTQAHRPLLLPQMPPPAPVREPAARRRAGARLNNPEAK